MLSMVGVDPQDRSIQDRSLQDRSIQDRSIQDRQIVDPERKKYLHAFRINGQSLALKGRPIVLVVLEGLAVNALERSSHYGKTPWIRSLVTRGNLRMLRSMVPATSDSNFVSLLSVRPVSEHGSIASHVFDPYRNVYVPQTPMLTENVLAAVQSVGGNVLAVTAEESFAEICRQKLHFFPKDSDVLAYLDPSSDLPPEVEQPPKPKKKKKKLKSTGESKEATEATEATSEMESKNAKDPLKSDLSRLDRRPAHMGRAVVFSTEKMLRAKPSSSGIDGNKLFQLMQVSIYHDNLAEDVDLLCRSFMTAFDGMNPALSILKMPQSLAFKIPASSASVAEILQPLDRMLAFLDQLGVVVWMVSASSLENCRDSQDHPPNIAQLSRLLDGFETGIPSKMRKPYMEQIRLRSLGCGHSKPYDEASGIASVFLPDTLKNDMRFRQDFIEYLLWEPGIDNVTTAKAASNSYGTPLRGMGDMVLFAESGWIFVNGPEEEAVARATFPLRTTGSLWTRDLAFLSCGKSGDLSLAKNIQAIHDVWQHLKGV